MIIGSKDVDYDLLKAATKSNNALANYAVSLVPRCIRHIPQIVDNQKYFVALTLRDLKAIPYTLRKERCEELLHGVSIAGVVNTIIDFEDILLQVDMDLLVQYLFKEAHDG